MKTHLHTSPIVVKIKLCPEVNIQNMAHECGEEEFDWYVSFQNELVNVATVDCDKSQKLCGDLGREHSTYFYNKGAVEKNKGIVSFLFLKNHFHSLFESSQRRANMFLQIICL